MRNIAVRGTALAQPPLAPGVVSYQPESLVYWLAKNGECTYVLARDVVSDGRYAEMMAVQAEANMQAWARAETGGIGPKLFFGVPELPPTPAQVAALAARRPVRVG